MAEDLKISKGTKEERYLSVFPQIKALLEGEANLIANMANISAALKEQFDWLWVGFYLVDSLKTSSKKGDGIVEDELVLGPFQGPVACNRIKKGRGVCGKAWVDEACIIVPDVDRFPGHIACSSLSKSEIVVPVIRSGKVIAVLDVDSQMLSEFDEIDQRYLIQIVDLLVYC